MLSAAKRWARAIKRDVLAVYLAARDPRTPWGVRVLAMAVAAYALSPIDLIPDFIPVLGYLDDLLIVPLGILLVVRLIPPDLLAEHRAAAARRSAQPVSVAAAAVMVALWLAAGVLLWRWLSPSFEGWLI
ncbi:YkvA family protein [Azospirillum melinis]